MCLHRVFIAALACGLASGCASITGSDMQQINLETIDGSGNHVAGADCRATNDHGSWTVKSPGFVPVRKSAQDLEVLCQHEGQQPGRATAVSRVNTGMFGNIVFGGVVGAAIDHTKGTAYDYPSFIRVVFGTSRIVDKHEEEPEARAPLPAVAPPPATPDPPPNQPVKLEDLNGLLPAK